MKILIFGALLLLGVFNQFWLHPRVDALRGAGDERPLHVLLVRRFPLAVTVETLLGAAVLLVAPFLHGSARTQAYQGSVAHHSAAPLAADALPKLPPKPVSLSTWVWGTSETLLVVAVMIACYCVSARLSHRRPRTPAPA